MEVHHVKPLHLGGAPFDLANLATLCRDCHIEHHRPPVDPERAAWAAFLKTFQPTEGGSNHDKFTALERSPERDPATAQ